jgi:hypothetical protein
MNNYFTYIPANKCLKVFICFAFILCIAQKSYSQRFIGKIIVGINGSQIDGDKRSGYNQPGLLLGIGTAFPINDKWSFEPEMIFSQKGSRTSNDEIDMQGLSRIRFRCNYLELPLIVNYHLNNLWVLCGGVHANLLINAESDAGFGDYQDDTKNWKTFDLCSSLGLELRPVQWFAFNMRLSYSVLSANKLLSGQYASPNFAGIQPGLFNNTVSVSGRFILNSNKNK